MNQSLFLRILIVALTLAFFACSSGPKKVEAALSVSEKSAVRIPVISMSVAQVGQSLCPKTGADLNKKKLKELIQMGNSCMRVEEFTRLEEVGTELNRKEPFQPWGSFFLSVAAEAKGEIQRAKWMIELALKKNPSYGILFYQKGRLLWADKQFADSMQLVKKAVDMDAGLTDGHYFLGQIYFRDQEWELASEHFYTVLKARPSHLGAISGLAESRMYRGDYQGALEVLNRAIGYYPEAVEFQWRQAQIYETGLNDKVNALNAYIQLKRRLLKNPSKMITLAEVESKIQQIEKKARQPALTSASPVSEKTKGVKQ